MHLDKLQERFNKHSTCYHSKMVAGDAPKMMGGATFNLHTIIIPYTCNSQPYQLLILPFMSTNNLITYLP